MEYELLWFDDFLEIRTHGLANLQGFKDFIHDFLKHENWHQGGAILINHLELDATPLTNDDLREMAHYTVSLQPQIGQAKIAILVARDLEYGLGRMWQAFTSEGRSSVSEIFRSRDEAISWLKGKT